MSHTRFHFLIMLLVSGCSLLLLAFLWLTNLPLGIPGEWTWLRISYRSEEFTSSFIKICLSLFLGSLLLTIMFAGQKRLEQTGRWGVACWLALMMTGSFGWLSFLQEAPRSPFDQHKHAWVLYYPSSSGYYYEARYEMQNVESFLTSYEERMSEGDVLHVGTHPPGLFCFIVVC